MEWQPYYKIFINLNNSFKHIRKNCTTITMKHVNSANMDKNVLELIAAAKPIEDELKRNFEIKQITNNHNIYTLLEEELKEIINLFINNEFQKKATANNKSKGKHPYLLKYNLDKLNTDLSKGELDTNQGGEVAFLYIYAYTQYWNWLHEQKSTFSYFSYWRQLEHNSPDHEQKELTNVILQIYPTPFAVVEELKLFFSSLDDETVVMLVDYAKDRAYSLYINKDYNTQKEHLKPIFHAVECQPQKEENLKMYYTEIEKYLNQTSTNTPTVVPTHLPTPTQNQKLIWNGQKNTLADIFYQLKNMYVKKGGKQVPLIDNSFDEIAVFLKANFNCFENTKLSTVETTLTKEDNKPKKSTGKISVIQGFLDE